MYGFEYPGSARFKRVCLEVSLKPFGLDISENGIRDTCLKLFDIWHELIMRSNSISVLLWVSDGSEILEYDGDMFSEFDWARYIGIGNPKKELPPWDPEGKELHSRPFLYMRELPKMTYAVLKRIVCLLKETAKELFGKDIEVGETFDPGPEFAYSDFKFHRHPELNVGTMMDSMWIHCAGKLHADSCHYAAYPDGIPEGTSFGTFLGRQFMALKEDTGFDYLWLSNGFGYALQAWKWQGEVFDGTRFLTEKMISVRENIRVFWESLTAETGNVRIETRGSNFSAAIDISAHGCPIDAVYGFPVTAPPNSPWAALNYRFGLELCGYMSRISVLPEKGYLFRYYTHDPWWYNSPWFDRYDRSPHDIYLPLSVARMDAKGNVTTPAAVNIMTADDSYGQMPRRCPAEVTPFLLDAYSHFPDEPGLLVWVYPFRDYCRCGENRQPERIFMDDWLIESAIDHGLPLNTVICDEDFAGTDLSLYQTRILVMPVPQKDDILESALARALGCGCRVILYGNPAYASDEVRRLIGVEETEALEGEVEIETDLIGDRLRSGQLPLRLRHCALVSDGGLSEKGILGQTKPLVWVRQGRERRLYAAFNGHAGKGQAAWLRGSFPHDDGSKTSVPSKLDPGEYFVPGRLMRCLLSCFGLRMEFESEDVSSPLPVMQISAHRNAHWYTGFARDTTTVVRISVPEGAPLFSDRECIVENDASVFGASRWWHSECRFYVKQKERSVITVLRQPAAEPAFDELFKLFGLKDATLTVRAPRGARLKIVSGKARHILYEPELPYVLEDGVARVPHITGSCYVAWQTDDNPGCAAGEDQRELKRVTEARR